MNVWLLVCLVAGFMGSWATAVHAQGAFEDCCLGYHRNVTWRQLQHARRHLHQEVSGSCNLPAVIFYFPKNRILCGNPRDKEVQKALNLLFRRRIKSSHNSWKALQASLAGKKKLHSGKSKFKDSSSSSKRNASLSDSRIFMTTKGINSHKLLRMVHVPQAPAVRPL
ncbi:C-C motif chemokine 25 [Castor canadensis]|uniref:C-C motif chemokine 25 n=2 Tax=Castor canadensis TaxID=51338 RepID=A0AC58KX98_CASCN